MHKESFIQSIQIFVCIKINKLKIEEEVSIDG